MIKPTSRNINILSIIISVIIFFLTNGLYNFWTSYDKMSFQVSFNSPEKQETVAYNINEEVDNNPEEQAKEKKKDNTEEYTKSQSNWTIEIPEINLFAEISEGTTTDVMNKYVGHFEETKTEYGNIGLAAHNRGYPVNFFQDLKKLKEGSEILYKHGDYQMTYVVKTMEIIENTNWNYLKNTEDNRITLITCVENEPRYRRCIQGIEKIESEEF